MNANSRNFDKYTVSGANSLNPQPFSAGQVISPKAKDRFYDLIEREQFPEDVRETLAGALTGDLRRQQLLLQAMMDTWPRLQKNVNEALGKAALSNWIVEAHFARGQEPTPKSLEKAEFVEDALAAMKSRPDRREMNIAELTKSLGYGYYAGHQVVETLWAKGNNGIMPRSSRVLPPSFYGYPYADHDEDDRLMLNKEGYLTNYNFEDFPEHHFLLSVNGGHPGHASVAAPLRALTGYWLAAVFGLKWLLQFTQLYGVPFRWATYTDPTIEGKVCSMLEDMGTQSWGAMPEGTDIEFLDASKSASQLPQQALIEMADMQCDTFILGQTLTTSAGDKGSQALGNIHQDVRGDMIQCLTNYVADIYNSQLIPSIIELNYGDTEELPCYKAKLEKPKDEKGMVERDRILFKEMKLPVSLSYLYDRHNVPEPEEGDDDLFNPDDEIETMEGREVKAFNKDQKRAKKGTPNGGQFIKEDSTGSSQEDEDAKYLRLAQDPEGNKEELETMVEKAARDAGYDSPKVFHGTTSGEFNKFDKERAGENGNMMGNGFYFTTDEESARNFINATYINPENGRVFPAFLKTGKSEEFDIKKHGMFAKNKPRSVNTLIRNRGRERIYVVFNPDQIKSSDTVTIDDKGELVPLSQRFNDSTDDIRFSNSRQSDKGLLKASESIKSNIEKLSENVMKELTGVTKEWLSPIRPHFERVAALAMSDKVSDDDFLKLAELSAKEMPELFHDINSEVLEESFNNSISPAMLGGSVERYD